MGHNLFFWWRTSTKKEGKMKLPNSTTFGYCQMQVVVRASKVNSISIPTKSV
jgi:hypothetical protein